MTSTGSLQQQVNTPTLTATATAISSSNPSLVGQSVTFTATVTAANGSTPTGSVQFTVNGTALGGPATLNGSGVAVSTTTTTLPAGHNTVTASYTATGDFQNSSNTLTQTVNASTSTALSSSANPSLVGQSVTFTATVTANNGTTPTGSVQFAVDGTVLGSPVTLNGSGVAVSSADSSLSAGPHTVTASYSPTGFFVSSTGTLTQQVDDHPGRYHHRAELLHQPVGVRPGGGLHRYGHGRQWQARRPAVCSLSSTAVIWAAAVALNGSGVAVSMTTTTLPAGANTVMANYLPTGNFEQQQYADADGQRQYEQAAELSANPSLVGQSVTFTATVARQQRHDADRQGEQFAVDGTVLGSPVTLNGSGVAVSSADSSLSAGPHTVTASYSPTGFFVSSTGTLTQQVNSPTLVAITTAPRAPPPTRRCRPRGWPSPRLRPRPPMAARRPAVSICRQRQ